MPIFYCVPRDMIKQPCFRKCRYGKQSSVPVSIYHVYIQDKDDLTRYSPEKLIELCSRLPSDLVIVVIGDSTGNNLAGYLKDCTNLQVKSFCKPGKRLHQSFNEISAKLMKHQVSVIAVKHILDFLDICMSNQLEEQGKLSSYVQSLVNYQAYVVEPLRLTHPGASVIIVRFNPILISRDENVDIIWELSTRLAEYMNQCSLERVPGRSLLSLSKHFHKSESLGLHLSRKDSSRVCVQLLKHLISLQ